MLEVARAGHYHAHVHRLAYPDGVSVDAGFDFVLADRAVERRRLAARQRLDRHRHHLGREFRPAASEKSGVNHHAPRLYLGAPGERGEQDGVYLGDVIAASGFRPRAVRFGQIPRFPKSGEVRRGVRGTARRVGGVESERVGYLLADVRRGVVDLRFRVEILPRERIQARQSALRSGRARDRQSALRDGYLNRVGDVNHALKPYGYGAYLYIARPNRLERVAEFGAAREGAVHEGARYPAAAAHGGETVYRGQRGQMDAGLVVNDDGERENVARRDVESAHFDRNGRLGGLGAGGRRRKRERRQRDDERERRERRLRPNPSIRQCGYFHRVLSFRA